MMLTVHSYIQILLSGRTLGFLKQEKIRCNRWKDLKELAEGQSIPGTAAFVGRSGSAAVGPLSGPVVTRQRRHGPGPGAKVQLKLHCGKKAGGDGVTCTTHLSRTIESAHPFVGIMSEL